MGPGELGEVACEVHLLRELVQVLLGEELDLRPVAAEMEELKQTRREPEPAGPFGTGRHQSRARQPVQQTIDRRLGKTERIRQLGEGHLLGERRHHLQDLDVALQRA